MTGNEFITGSTTSTYDAYGNNQLGLPMINSIGALPGIAATPVSGTLSLSNITSSQSYNELTVNKLIIGGGSQITITPSDDIQHNLDAINAAGGGILFLSAGTYTPQTTLTGYTTVQIVGISSTNTIIDFGSTSKNLSFTGTNLYTTGTISSIASGVNVTGSGTAWLSNVKAGYYMFLGTRWYLIAVVTSDTTLILAEKYTDTLTMPGLAYITGNPVLNAAVKNVTLQNSTGTALVFTDCHNFDLEGVLLLTNAVGMSMANCSECVMTAMNSVSNTGDGLQITNAGLFNISSFNCSSNGGNGATLNNLNTVPFLFSNFSSNTGDGLNCTSVINTQFKVAANANGGQGIEFVSGCNANFIDDSIIDNNTSDGIKLTASSSNNTLGGALNLVSNGGYGINIANSNDNNNTIIVPYFASNSSGTYTDSGTSSNIVATVPTQVNFTAGETIVKAAAVAIGDGSTGNAISQTSQNSHVTVVGSGTVHYYAQTFTTIDGQVSITNVHTWSKGNAGSGGNWIVSIRATAGGVPTGGDLGSVTSVVASDNADNTWTFGSPITVSPNTVYALVMQINSVGAGDSEQAFYQNTDVYAGGGAYDGGTGGSSWATISSSDFYFKVTGALSTAGRLTNASSAANNWRYTNFIGFADKAVSNGQTTTVTSTGSTNYFSGLTFPGKYYLNDANGTIGASAGSNSLVVGFSANANDLIIKLNNF